jgi:hypothetical protein
VQAVRQARIPRTAQTLCGMRFWRTSNYQTLQLANEDSAKTKSPLNPKQDIFHNFLNYFFGFLIFYMIEVMLTLKRLIGYKNYLRHAQRKITN